MDKRKKLVNQTSPLRLLLKDKMNSYYIETDEDGNVKAHPVVQFGFYDVVSKNAVCTTVAATAVWTPAAGKKWRIMGGVIIFGGAMAAAGIELVSLLDGATDIGLDFQSFLPAAAAVLGVGTVVPFTLPGNGIISANPDAVLNVTLTAAMTAGAVSVTVFGREE